MKQPVINRINEQAASNLIEYVLISGICMVLLMVLLMTVNTSIMEGPADTLTYAAFTDIGNGISTRIVDVYIIAPYNGSITTQFDIPDDVAQKDYFVEIGATVGSTDQVVEISRDYIKSSISLAGIGATRGIRGNTTGRGLNKISYNSGGY